MYITKNIFDQDFQVKLKNKNRTQIFFSTQQILFQLKANFYFTCVPNLIKFMILKFLRPDFKEYFQSFSFLNIQLLYLFGISS